MRRIVFCITCRHSVEDREGPDGQTGGETLARHMEAVLKDTQRHDIVIDRQTCLWACLRHCNVFLQDSDRYSYLAGGFVPARETAEAILAWFDLHGESETGEVPFKTWPQAMRGHFIARFPSVKT